MASTWLDQLYLVYRVIRYGGSSLPSRPFFNFHGSGVSVTDDPANNATDIEIGEGGGGVTDVTAVAPLTSTGGSTPQLALAPSGQTWGDVLYFNGTSWSRLAAGTTGQFLKTLGGGANPSWATIAITLAGDVTGATGSNTVVSLTGSTGIVTMASANLASGATPATTGRYRLSQADLIKQRDSSNSANINIWNCAANNATLGDSTNLASLELGAGGFFDLNVSGTITFESSSSLLIDLVPMRFNNVSAPSTPTGGPVVYGIAGALTAKGTSGTITTLAPA